MTTTTRLTKSQRVEAARQLGLARRPLPMLLVLVRCYVQSWSGLGDDGKIVLGRESDRAATMATLRRRLDQVDPERFEAVVLAWAREFKARWIPRE